MSTTSSTDRVKSKIFDWLTPSLVTAVGVMVWTQLSEVRQDIKTLLEAVSYTEAKLMMLEKEVDYLRSNVVYNDRQYQQPSLQFPYDRATPKKEEGPRVPNPEATDKERL